MSQLFMRLFLSAASVSVTAALGATVVPSYTVGANIYDVYVNKGPLTDFGTLQGGGTGVFGTTSGVFTALGNPSPSLLSSTASSCSAPGCGLPQAGIRSVGELDYYFEILGPAAHVPVIAKAIGNVSGTANGPSEGYSAYAAWALSIYGIGGNLAGDSALRNSGPSGSASFNDTVSLTLDTNVVYLVKLIADTSTGAQQQGGAATAMAFVDPLFQFGPGLVNPQDFSFVLSPGVGNSPGPSGVPEPSTAGLCVAGFLLLFARSTHILRR